MAKTWNYQIAGDLAVSTTGNIDDLDPAGNGQIRMTNASLATIRGLKAGFPGQRVTIVSAGAGQVSLAHQHAGSAAENRLINFVTSGVTPLAAGVGTATLEYDGTTARWRLVNHNQGAPIDVPFAGGNFTASAGTWGVDSGDQITLAYFVSGRFLTLIFFIQTTNVTNASRLRIANPNGYTASFYSRLLIQVIDAGAAQVGIAYTSPGAAFVECAVTAAGADFAVTAANDTGMNGSFTFAIP